MAGSITGISQRIILGGADDEPPTNPTDLVRSRRQSLASQAGGSGAERVFTSSPLFAHGKGDVGKLVNTTA